MPTPHPDLVAYLIDRIETVRANLGHAVDERASADARFADLLDSMGMVEFLGLLADDCGLEPAAIEECTDRRFGTIAELAEAMARAGYRPRLNDVTSAGPDSAQTALRAAPRAAAKQAEVSSKAWLGGVSVRLPSTVQLATELDDFISRPRGWLEARAGIRSRRIWAATDPLNSAVDSARETLERCGVS